MRGRLEFVFYVSVGVGMALACSSFMVIGGLFDVATLFWLLVALLLSAAFCTVIALSIGELASLFPSAPAIRTYIKAAFGDRVSLSFVYLYLLFLIGVAGVECYVFALVAHEVAPWAPPLAVICVLLTAVTCVNLLGLEMPRVTQMALAGLTVVLVTAIGLGTVVASPGAVAAAAAPGPALDGLAVLPGAVALAVFLFMGFEWVTPLGLRPQAYARKVPWSMPVAIGVLTLAYGAFMVGAAVTLPAATLAGSTTPQVAYLRDLLGSAGLPLAALLSLLAIVSTFNAGLMGGSRLVLILSREGHLPRWCGTMSLRTGAPVGAVLILAGLAAAAAVSVRGFRMELVVAVAGAAVICVIYAGYVAAAVRLRQTAPDRPRQFSSPVPLGGQMTVAAVLPLLGVATLFSLPEHIVAPSLIVFACLALVLTLSGWSLRRRTAATAPGQRTVDARAEAASP